MPNLLFEFALLPDLSLRSACDLNLPLLLGAVMLGGLIATLALVGWLYLRGRRATDASKFVRGTMSAENQHVERDRPPL